MIADAAELRALINRLDAILRNPAPCPARIADLLCDTVQCVGGEGLVVGTRTHSGSVRIRHFGASGEIIGAIVTAATDG
jgi:hypothetical protein